MDYFVRLSKDHKGEVLIPGVGYPLSNRRRSTAVITEEQYHRTMVSVLIARGILIEEDAPSGNEEEEPQEQEIDPGEIDNEKTQNTIQAWDFDNGKLLDVSDSKEKVLGQSNIDERETIHVDVDEAKAPATKKRAAKKTAKKTTKKRTTKRAAKKTTKKVTKKAAPKKKVNKMKEAFESLHADPIAEPERDDLDFVYDNEPEDLLFVDQEQEVQRSQKMAVQNEEVE